MTALWAAPAMAVPLISLVCFCVNPWYMATVFLAIVFAGGRARCVFNETDWIDGCISGLAAGLFWRIRESHNKRTRGKRCGVNLSLYVLSKMQTQLKEMWFDDGVVNRSRDLTAGHGLPVCKPLTLLRFVTWMWSFSGWLRLEPHWTFDPFPLFNLSPQFFPFFHHTSHQLLSVFLPPLLSHYFHFALSSVSILFTLPLSPE